MCAQLENDSISSDDIFFSSGLTSLRIRISFARGNLCRFARLCSFNGNIKCDFSSHICMFWGHIICCFETQIQFVLMIFTNEWQNNPNVPRLIVNMWCWPGIVMQNKNVHRYLRTHIREYPSLKHNHVIHSFDAVIFASSIKIKPKCNVFVFLSKYARQAHNILVSFLSLYHHAAHTRDRPCATTNIFKQLPS